MFQNDRNGWATAVAKEMMRFNDCPYDNQHWLRKFENLWKPWIPFYR